MWAEAPQVRNPHLVLYWYQDCGLNGPTSAVARKLCQDCIMVKASDAPRRD